MKDSTYISPPCKLLDQGSLTQQRAPRREKEDCFEKVAAMATNHCQHASYSAPDPSPVATVALGQVGERVGGMSGAEADGAGKVA